MAGRRIPRSIRLRCNGDPLEKVDLLHRFADFDRAAAGFFAAAASLRTV